MTPKDKREAALLIFLAWILWKRAKVSATIDYPEGPPGQCYDPETDSYYVGDC